MDKWIFYDRSPLNVSCSSCVCRQQFGVDRRSLAPLIASLCARLLSGSVSLVLVGPDLQSSLQCQKGSKTTTGICSYNTYRINTDLQYAKLPSKDILSVNYTRNRNACLVIAFRYIFLLFSESELTRTRSLT